MSSFADDPGAVLDGLSDPIAVVDERMLITSANRAAANLIGVDDPSDLLGHSGLEWVHEPDRIDAVDRLAALIDRNQPSPVSLRLVRADGTITWVEVTGATIRNEQGAIRSLLSFRNVDWRREADLDAARVVRRAHVLVSAALDLQSSSPRHLTSVLGAVADGIGSAVGALSVNVHEVEPDGSTMVSRARWVSADRGPRIPDAPESIALERLPNWVNALNSSQRGAEVSTERLGIQSELMNVEPTFTEGISISLYPGERLLGALTVGLRPGGSLSSDERDFLDHAAKVLGVALHRVRSQEALVESEAMFRDLFEGSSAIMYLVDPEGLRLIEANQAAATFYGYHREAMAGMDLHELTIHTRSELAAMVDKLRAGGTTIIDEQQLLSNGEIRTVEIHSTPMRLGNRTLDLAIVQDVTEQRRAVERLERLAATDDLTGILNRRRFLQVVSDEIERAQRYGSPLSLLMLDLDHFKAINDSFGHLAGDAVLVAFAAECSSHLRINDRFARMGGEEFTILLPETDLEHAAVLGERIRVSTEKMMVPEVDGPPPCTVSIGGAAWQPGWFVDELFAHADRMLYRAKQGGRNRYQA